jgi:DNA-binding LacI/PurR family transcriptional regulator
MPVLKEQESSRDIVERDLREQIRSGALKPGDKILPEKEISLHYSLSQGTVRKVILQLVSEGLLARNGRGGTVVTSESGYDGRGRTSPKSFVFACFPSVDFDAIHSVSYYNSIYAGLEKEALKNGDDISIQMGNFFERRLSLMNGIRSGDTDGVILAGTALESVIDELKRVNHPSVLVDFPTMRQDVDAVYPDNIGGGYMAARHLLDHGHKSIGTLVPMFGKEESMQAGFAARLFGALEAQREEGIMPDASLTVRVDIARNFRVTARGRAALMEFLQSPVRPSAIFLASDILAASVYEAARELGLVIPDDLSVAGFDGISRSLTPALTTVVVDREEMGALAFRRLAAVVTESADTHINHVLPVSLQTGGSVVQATGE